MRDLFVIAQAADSFARVDLLNRGQRTWDGGGGPIARLEVVLWNGTRVTIADAPGEAVQFTVIGPDGGPVVDVTMRGGPSGVD